MQTTKQKQLTTIPVETTQGYYRPRLSKEEIAARFIPVEASRQSVLGMVKSFYDNKRG